MVKYDNSNIYPATVNNQPLFYSIILCDAGCLLFVTPVFQINSLLQVGRYINMDPLKELVISQDTDTCVHIRFVQFFSAESVITNYTFLV